jgi:hypothetical protein
MSLGGFNNGLNREVFGDTNNSPLAVKERNAASQARKEQSESELMKQEHEEYRRSHGLELGAVEDNEGEDLDDLTDEDNEIDGDKLVSCKLLRDMSPTDVDKKIWDALEDIVVKEGNGQAYKTVRHLLGRLEEWWARVRDLPENRDASRMTHRELLDWYVRKQRPVMFGGKQSRFVVNRMEPPRQRPIPVESMQPPRMTEQDSLAGYRVFHHNAADQYRSAQIAQLPLQIVIV